MSALFDQHSLLYERGCLVEGVRQYILSVICVSIVCGLVQLIFGKGSFSSLIKWITGLAVMITAINPLLNDSLWQWDKVLNNINLNSQEYISQGQSYAEEATAEIIMQKTSAYILNKAAALGVEITVEVQLRETYPNTPETVWLEGDVSPYIKRQLTHCAVKELGITEENVIWM